MDGWTEEITRSDESLKIGAKYQGVLDWPLVAIPITIEDYGSIYRGAISIYQSIPPYLLLGGIWSRCSEVLVSRRL